MVIGNRNMNVGCACDRLVDESGLSAVAWNSALTYDMIFTQPVCYEFADLVMPTLLVVGSLDRTPSASSGSPAEVRKTLGDYPDSGEKGGLEIPECQLEILEGIGHVPQIEAPNVLFPILLEFLQGLRQARDGALLSSRHQSSPRSTATRQTSSSNSDREAKASASLRTASKSSLAGRPALRGSSRAEPPGQTLVPQERRLQRFHPCR